LEASLGYIVSPCLKTKERERGERETEREREREREKGRMVLDLFLSSFPGHKPIFVLCLWVAEHSHHLKITWISSSRTNIYELTRTDHTPPSGV
jgi:hypothetical protein